MTNTTLNWYNLKFECKECHDRNEGHGLSKKREVSVTRKGLMVDSQDNLIKVGKEDWE